MASDRDIKAAVAVTRFGLGARPGEIDAVRADPEGWLLAQIRPAGADPLDGVTQTSAQRLAQLYEYQARRRDARMTTETPPAPAVTPMADTQPAATPPAPAERPGRAAGRDLLVEEAAEEFLARTQLGASTPAGFRERWALFWSNHLTVSGVKLITATVAGPYEREAIRPHVFGRFEDLLLASARHPAMLLYLDQAQSVGPNSPAGQRRDAGLNENLAREILELHTVGADAGYSQADVTEFARALTGWTVAGARDPRDRWGAARFRPIAHEPGSRTVLGRAYPDTGERQSEAVLRDLAQDPRTGRRLARKIASHFVADAPPPTLVAKLEQAWMGSGGDLAAVARALVAAPEAWTPAPAKLKTPYEFLVSSYRAAGLAPRRSQQVTPVLLTLGQRPFSPPSPEGWPDDAESWGAPDAVLKRLQFAEAFAQRAAPTRPPIEAAQAALGARLSPALEQAVRRAESREEAFTLLLMSPEFQRR